MSAARSHGAAREADSVELRRPTESDHASLVAAIDDWWGGRRVRHLLPRLWFRHFSGTSWLAEHAGGRPVGFLVGFTSYDRVDEAQLYLLGVDPNHRRRGIARALEAAFAADARSAGAQVIRAEIPPGDPVALRALRALGFAIDTGPGSTPIHGTPAFADHDGPGEDRVVLVRRLLPAR